MKINEKPVKINEDLQNHVFIGIFSHFLPYAHQRNSRHFGPEHMDLFLKIIPGSQERIPSSPRMIISTISPGLPAWYMVCPCELGGKSTKPAT